MGIIKDRYGTYYVQRRVPAHLQEAVAHILDADEPRRVFLKKSLGTKNLKEAKVAAPPILADFNRILGEAEASLKERPPVTTLTDTQIKRMAESYYAKMLADDEKERREGTGSEPVFQRVAKQLSAAGIEHLTPFAVGELPVAGLSDREIYKRKETLDFQLAIVPAALARGDSTVISKELDELLYLFQINLDRKSEAYRKLGTAALAAHVRGLKDIERRDAGEPVETPQAVYPLPGATVSHEGGTLRDALEGWKKERARPDETVHEYTRAVEMFIQLHGNLAVVEIKRRHALAFREAIQLVPRRRSGKLLKATLPELIAWSKEHPDAARVAAGTINKQLGALQAVCGWAHSNGLLPDDATWADPFHKIRVEEDRSDRAPFVKSELQVVFDDPLFTAQEWPVGARGAAGVWLPLLALFTGARQAEIGGLRASNITEDEDTRTPLMYVVRDTRAGRRIKTKASERVIPIHPQLVELGFLNLVAERRRKDGDGAWLFPLVSTRAGIKAWSKWWGRYLRDTIGVKDTAKVFHSFRHGVKDALRRARVDYELREALVGHSLGSTVSGGYGAPEMLARWGVEALRDAVSKITYPGLDLSRVQAPGTTRTTRGTKGN
jgi:integrase